MDIVETYLTELETAIATLSRDGIRAVVDALIAVWERSGTAYIIGNGGSASTASHMMNDLMKFTSLQGCRRFRAVALTDNVPLMTALGNDVAFEDIFAEPLRNLIGPDDALVALSGSGNSPNIVKAIEYANSVGATTIGLCGSPGGRLSMLARHVVRVPADRIGQQEDGHLILNHVIAAAMRERIALTASQLQPQATAIAV
jgi:D-sedoheptulose 7-phosphate isomerase